MEKIEKGILVVVVAAILGSVASAGNVNPTTVTMEGNSVVGPGIGQSGPVDGLLEGTVDSDQTFTFYTNSPWHVEVHKATIKEDGSEIGTFSRTLPLAEGSTTGENSVTQTNREILVAIAGASGDTDFDPDNWKKTGETYTVIIDFWLYSDDKVGNTYIRDTITFWWDSTAGVWKQTHKITIWSDGETEIPEFTTIAIPVAGLLGLLFLFSRRRTHK